MVTAAGRRFARKPFVRHGQSYHYSKQNHLFSTSKTDALSNLIKRGDENIKFSHRRLGKSHLSVTELSLGGVGLGGCDERLLYGPISDEQAVSVVHQALEHGINYIDTSPLYGKSERRIGLALNGLSDQDRERLVISSRVGDECSPYSNNGGHDAFSYEGTRCSVEHSLKQMGLSHLDLVLLHDPYLNELERFVAPQSSTGGGMEA